MRNNQHSNDDEGAFAYLDFIGDSLDPTPLVNLIPMDAGRPKKKGDPIGRLGNGQMSVSKTGYCGFCTGRAIPLGRADPHVEYVLNIVEGRISAIKQIVADQSLRWELILIEGTKPGERFSDLSPALLQRAKDLGLKLMPERDHT